MNNEYQIKYEDMNEDQKNRWAKNIDRLVHHPNKNKKFTEFIGRQIGHPDFDDKYNEVFGYAELENANL